MTTSARYASALRSLARVEALAETNDLVLALGDLHHCCDCPPNSGEPPLILAARRMQDARAALPGAQSYDAPSVSGGSATLTGPERLADQLDRTQWDRDLLDRLLNDLTAVSGDRGIVIDTAERDRTITVKALQLRRLIDAWTPRRPTSKDLRAVAVANAPAADCEHHTSAGIFEPAHSTGTVGGNLNIPMRLCLACHNQVRRNGKLPSGEWMERRRRTGKDEKERIA